MSIKYLALKSDIPKGSFTIAAANSIYKQADLVLTGDPDSDRAAINNAFTMLDDLRGNNSDIAVRIDFMGGEIDLGAGQIVVPYDNFHLYGNGVKIESNINYTDTEPESDNSVIYLVEDNIIFDGFVVSCAHGYGLYNGGTNCTIRGNTCSSGGDVYDLYNIGTSCTITGNICSGSRALYNGGTNCTIRGNICSSRYDALYNTGTKCTITGNTCSGGYAGICNKGTNCTIISNPCSGNESGIVNSGANCTISCNTCHGGSSSGIGNSGANCTISSNTCSSGRGNSISNSDTNCTISSNTCHSGSLYNIGTSCTIIGNICSGDDGIYNGGVNCTITGNTCGSNNGNALYNNTTSTTGKCVITGNICDDGDISVLEGTCLPATQEAMADVNTGTITIRS